MIKLSPSKLNLFIILFLLVFLIGCTSKPPGCRSSIGFGGCNAEYMIKDVKSEPRIRCIDIDVNNCADPDIIIMNLCETDLYIEMEKKTDEEATPEYKSGVVTQMKVRRIYQEEIMPAYVIFAPEFESTTRPIKALIPPGKAFSVRNTVAPTQDTTYQLTCKLEKDFIITYTLTKELC